MPTLSYMGLNPRESSSGGRQRLGAISKQGNSMVRYLLVEAAQAAARYDEELRRDYQRLKFILRPLRDTLRPQIFYSERR